MKKNSNSWRVVLLCATQTSENEGQLVVHASLLALLLFTCISVFLPWSFCISVFLWNFALKIMYSKPSTMSMSRTYDFFFHFSLNLWTQSLYKLWIQTKHFELTKQNYCFLIGSSLFFSNYSTLTWENSVAKIFS